MVVGFGLKPQENLEVLHLQMLTPPKKLNFLFHVIIKGNNIIKDWFSYADLNHYGVCYRPKIKQECGTWPRIIEEIPKCDGDILEF